MCIWGWPSFSFRVSHLGSHTSFHLRRLWLVEEEVPPPSWRACGFLDAAAVVDRVMDPGGLAKVRGARLED